VSSSSRARPVRPLDWGFRDQIPRSGPSIPSNIAEDYERESNRDFINFLSYAEGSAGELRTQIYIGIDIGYIDRQTGKHWLSEAQQISKMLAALIKPENPSPPNTTSFSIHLCPLTFNL